MSPMSSEEAGRKQVMDILPEDVAEYVPEHLPDDKNPDSEPEAAGMFLGIALAEWAIQEKGMDPENARDMIQRALSHGVADAMLNSFDLPSLWRN
jgi:hypothetical protein